MTDITIPREALEAAAKDLRTSRQGNTVAVDWNALSDEAKTYWISKARAACLAMLRSWPGMYDNGPRKGWKHYTPAIILPLTEKPSHD